jgi:hypothetical protein
VFEKRVLRRMFELKREGVDISLARIAQHRASEFVLLAKF